MKEVMAQKVIIITAVSSLIAFFSFYLLQNITKSFYIPLPVFGINISIFAISIGIWKASLSLLNNYLLLIPPIRKLLKTPLLSGRYEGVYKRYNDQYEEKIVFEIKHTFSKITINSFTKNSHGKSIGEALLVEEENENYYLFYYWETETPRLSGKGKEKISGASLSRLILNKSFKVIEIHEQYFTNREEQTKGEVIAKFKSSQLINKFK